MPAPTVDYSSMVPADDTPLGLGTGSPAQLVWVTDDANSNHLVLQLPAGGAVDVPVLAIGQGAGLLGDMALWNGQVDPLVSLLAAGAVTTGPVIEMRKARGTLAAPTVVTSGDDLGAIRAYGAVAAGEWVQAAAIEFDMAGTIGTTRGPGTITFKTATDAAPSVLTTALTISAAQGVTFAGTVSHLDDQFLYLGTGNPAAIWWSSGDANANEMKIEFPPGGGVDVPALVLGVGIPSNLGLHNGIVDPTLALLSAGAWATGSVLEFRHARGTVAAPTVVTSGDDLGRLNFYGCVANGEYVLGASIEVDMVGTIATTRGPGTITFKTATDAAPSVLTTALSISAAQVVTMASGVSTGDFKLNLTLTAGADGVGGAGEQLTSGGAAAETNWAAAACVRDYKTDIVERADAEEALALLVSTPVSDFRYDPEKRRGTGDYETRYTGIMADEAPYLMHYGGTIINPINVAGYTILGFKALTKRLDAALARINQLEAQLA